MPPLESILAAALHRAELQAEVVETAALRRSDELKTAVLRSVSHDLRTPVTAILTAAGALDPRSADAGERRARCASWCIDAATRLWLLIEKLLDLSLLQAGRCEPRRELVLDRGGAARGDRADAGGATARSGSRSSATCRCCSGDPAQLERAFANVLENAARYSRRQARRRCARAPSASACACASSTRGPGIPPRRAASACSCPSTVAGDGGRAHHGSGLGLAIAKGFIEVNGGRIARRVGARSRARASSSSSRSPEARPADASPRRAAVAGGQGGVMAGERILVCDDDPQIRRALRLVLRDAGYRGARQRASGEEALDRAALAGPHAAIVDLMLPDLHGIEVCRRLREWSEMPILVLSALGEEAIKIEALQHGADDYVTKPFAPGELVARVQAALRRAGRDVSRAAHRGRRPAGRPRGARRVARRRGGAPDADRVRAAARARASTAAC